MNNKVALSSLAMDLKRVALGYHKQSFNTAKRFYEEALKRVDEIDIDALKPHIKKMLKDIFLLESQPSDRVAEDALMYSTLLQNYSQKLGE